MGKPTNGPDWTDVAKSMKSLEEAHGCVCSVVLSPAGISAQPRLCATVYAYHAAQGHLSGTPFVSVSGDWPHSGWKTTEGMVYNLLVQLDHEIAVGWYHQPQLPF